MKWLFLLLLLANIGIFAVGYPRQHAEVEVTVLPDVGGLTLAREKVDDVAVPELDESDSEIAEAPATPSVAAPLASVDETPPDAEPEKPSESLPEQAMDIAQEPEEILPYCAIVGYVESRSDAEQISVRLRALGVKPELQSEQRNEQAGYWVLIPPQQTRQDAIKIAKRLEQSGVNDLWRFTSGDLAHAISLGLFRDEDRAEVRRSEIEALGFESVIQPRYRESTRYWLSFQATGGNPIGDADWQGLLQDYPQLVSERTDCP
ncbi:MAG: hypothetical protein ABW095_18810 [Candidatus Thiodiazotropha sp.]